MRQYAHSCRVLGFQGFRGSQVLWGFVGLAFEARLRVAVPASTGILNFRGAGYQRFRVLGFRGIQGFRVSGYEARRRAYSCLASHTADFEGILSNPHAIRPRNLR